MIKSKSFKQFVSMQESNKPKLIELSQYKKERPEEYESYNEAYKKARNECMKAHNKGMPGYTSLNYMSIENIMKSAGVKYPDLPYEEAQKKIKETEARNKRIESGTATHEDYVSVMNERKGN